jgi:thiamine pyrophosphokinase
LSTPAARGGGGGGAAAAAAAAAVHLPVNTTDYLPDLITGDLDSLHMETRHYYEKLGVAIVKQYDQNYNDLDKAIRRIPSTYTTFLIYGAFGGRFDQEMGAIHALYVHGNSSSNTDDHPTQRQMWLYSDDNSAILLPPGPKHIIHCPNYGLSPLPTQLVLGEGPTCGLIPVGQPCTSVTTQGLQWNVQQQCLAFGTLVSSSNRIIASTVEIESSHPLLFTAEMQLPTML